VVQKVRSSPTVLWVCGHVNVPNSKVLLKRQLRVQHAHEHSTLSCTQGGIISAPLNLLQISRQTKGQQKTRRAHTHAQVFPQSTELADGMLYSVRLPPHV
jgi:hypothetical protein